MKLSDFSIRRPVFTLVIMIIFLILGAVSLTRIPLKLIPSINPPIGAVVASYQGAGPQEVSEKVTKPLEEQLGTLQGLKDISSTSQEGSSLVILQFNNSTNIDDIQSDIQNAIDRTQLPDDVKNARFLKFDPSQFPIIQMAVNSTQKSSNFQQTIHHFEQELSQVKGVASVSADGLHVDEVKVLLDQEKLKKYHLSQASIAQSLQANNVSLPGAKVESGDKELTTRVLAPLHSVKDIKKVIIGKNAKGETVTVDDVSKVSIAPENKDTITRNNQKPAVLLNILQQSDSNTETVSKDFQKKIDQLLKEPQYSSLKTSILVNQGTLVDQAIGSLRNALILGGLLAMAILFLFLKNFKTPLIIGISIPFSVIVTFVLVYFSGFTLNIMTLGGLALGIGMLVDNSIVVIENIYRHLSMGEDPRTAASKGTKEVGVAIIASTLTTVAVFLPVVFVSGIIGDLFKQFAFTIAFSLLASLFVALTVVPMMASRLLKAPDQNKEKKRRRTGSMQLLKKSAQWSLHHRLPILILAVLLFGIGIFGLTRVGTTFLPEQDQSFFTIDVSMDNGTSLAKTNQAVKGIEQLLSKKSDVKDYFSYIGGSQNQGPASTADSSKAQLSVKLVDPGNRSLSTAQFIENIRGEVKKAAPGAKEIKLNQQSSTGTEPNTLTFRIKDNNEKRLNMSVKKITDALNKMKNTQEVSSDLSNTVTELNILVDPKKAADYGLTPQQIAQSVNQATRGTDAAQITTSDNKVLTVHVAYDPSVKNTKQDLGKLSIQSASGKYIDLKDVADIKNGQSPVKINRTDQERAVGFTVKFSNQTTLGEYKSAVQKRISDLNLNKGTDVSYTGNFNLLQDSMNQLIMSFILAVVLVYLVMAAQFESFKFPFVILLSIPLIFIGVSIGLYITRTPISATALIGLVVLAGIVVNNAIVLVDYILQLKGRGYATFEAIVESVQLRTRPILMTALTTILGLVPVAFGIGNGTEIQQPMAITVIGGMISSTFLTLFIIPIIFSYFDKETRRRIKD